MSSKCLSPRLATSVAKLILIRSSRPLNYGNQLSQASTTAICHSMETQQVQIITGRKMCYFTSVQYTMPHPGCSRNLSKFLSPVSLLRNDCRNYKGKKRKGKEQESSSESESDSDSDEDEVALEDDLDAPGDYKLMKLHVKSLRVDSIVSGGLDIARNRVDEIFFANKLRLNGNKFTKKSKQITLGDYVDVITEKLEDVLKVKRVKIVKISSEKTRTDKHIVHVQVWRQPFEIVNADNKEW